MSETHSNPQFPSLPTRAWRLVKRKFQLGLNPYRLRPSELSQLFPGIERITITVPCRRVIADDIQLPYPELVILASVCKFLEARRVFEIGTYNGLSALTMAINSPSEAEICTLDLSPDLPFGVGSVYRGAKEEAKIRQLFGDSTKFDYQPYHGKMDFVFVDGNHAYEFARSDSENAFQMVRPGGVIIWDDYNPFSGHGVMRYLNALRNSKPLFWLAGTRFAILKNE